MDFGIYVVIEKGGSHNFVLNSMEEASDEDDDCNENGEVIPCSPIKFRCDFFRGKNLAYKIQGKFKLSNYQMLCLSFAKGFIIGAILL